MWDRLTLDELLLRQYSNHICAIFLLTTTDRPPPDFAARSKAHPEQVLTEPDDWAALWWDARDRIADGVTPMRLNARWEADARKPICA